MRWLSGRQTAIDLFEPREGMQSAAFQSVFQVPMPLQVACRITITSLQHKILLALLPALKRRKSASERVIDKGARATEEARLKTEYALKLAGVLKEAGLPVCQIIEGVEDAEEAWQRLFGSRRAKTLRNRFRSWSSFREWLVISRGRVYPTGIPDVLDYANERYHGACGKTVLDSFQAALSIIESVGRVPDSEQLSQDPTWQAQLKSYTADLVAAAPPEQPASMFTVAILVSLELLVCLAAAPQ